MTRVGELEAAVMNLVWSAPAPVTVRQVMNALRPDRDLAYTTVMTVMERLFRKKMLIRQPDGKAFAYSPVASRADYTAHMMAEVLHNTDDHTAALVHFAEQLTAKERHALRAALESPRRTPRNS